MKKILAILVLAFVPFLASAQTALYTTGVTHTIADQYLSAADSMHTIGIVPMRNGTQYADSIQVWVETSDSLNIRIFVVPVKTMGTAETVADSVAGAGFVTNVATGGFQFTAAGYAVVPWHNIQAALTQQKLSPASFRIYARVYAVGSEVASSGKKFRVLVKRFY